MSETINLDEGDRWSIEKWAAIAALAVVSDEAGRAELTGSGPVLTVELRINGVEVPFTQIIRRLNEHKERLAYEKAREIIEERAAALSDTLDKLGHLARDVEDHLKRGVGKIIPEVIREEDDYR